MTHFSSTTNLFEPDDVLFDLIEKLLAETITECEAKQLLPYFDHCDDLGDRIRKQIQLDAFLRSRTAFPEWYHLAENARDSSDHPDLELESVNWDEIMRYVLKESEERRLLVSSVTPEEKTFDYSFWIRGAKRIVPKDFDRKVRRGLALSLFVMFLAILVGGWRMYWKEPPPKRVVGHLLDARRVVWENPLEAPEQGGPVHVGPLKLLEGVALIKMLEGAELVLEGPTEIDLESTAKLRIRDGNLNADVPKQQEKLLIVTPQMEIEVLGTSFRVEANPDRTNVHLVRGKLRLNSPSFGSFQLGEREAFSLPRLGDSKRFAALLDAFIPPARIDSRADELDRQRLERWRQSCEAWNDRPDLVARFDFEEISENRLENRSRTGRERLESITAVGCTPCEGRWRGKNALRFNGRDSRVVLSLPGTFEELTLIASVQIETLDRIYSGILMSDTANTARKMGRLHWQIRDDGTLRVGFGPQGSKVLTSDSSRKVIKSNSFGQWMKLALVLDARQGRMRQYVNGVKVSDRLMPENVIPEIGSAHLGFWLSEDDDEPTRSFHGAMDEFLIFQRALNDTEIQQF